MTAVSMSHILIPFRLHAADSLSQNNDQSLSRFLWNTGFQNEKYGELILKKGFYNPHAVLSMKYQNKDIL